MFDFLTSIIRGLFRRLFAQSPVEADIVTLRHRVAVLQRQIRHRPKLTHWDRLLFAALYRVQPDVLRSISIVRPETVVRWHRTGFRRYWEHDSRGKAGRPRVPGEVRALIREISIANPLWGAPRIHGELLKLAIEVLQSMVANYKDTLLGWPVQYRGRIPGVDVRIVDEKGAGASPGEKGEVIVRSPGLMKGYLGMSGATADAVRDGWYRTRDYGAFDDEGYLFLYGRADSKILRGYERIDPVEIELILHEHPAVSLAAVIGVPHPELGQEAKAFVVLEKGQTIEADQLLGWLGRQLPDGKCPGILQFRQSLPLTDTGKVATHSLS